MSISPRQRLDDVVRATDNLPFGGTDCALPMIEVKKHGWEIDTFVVYTDSETWAGGIHPVQALRQYPERTGIAAKLVVVGMASDGFTIADPVDAGLLDVVGFDMATPSLISDFATHVGIGGWRDIAIPLCAFRGSGGVLIQEPSRRRTTSRFALPGAAVSLRIAAPRQKHRNPRLRTVAGRHRPRV